jgi:hypothetical protein
MLALLAAAVLVPLLYLPGYLVARALLGTAQPADLLERHYERVVAGALLNGWLALTLAELGVFSAQLDLLLLLAVCAICAALAWRRGALHLPQPPLGIAARPRRPTTQNVKMAGSRWRSAIRHWDALGFAAIGLAFALVVTRPFEVVLGARDAGVYTTSGFAIARNGGIVQYDELVRQIGLDRQSADPELRAAAAMAETNFLGVQASRRFIATRLRYAGYLINEGDMGRGRVVPQFFHLYPAWIALLTSMLGLRGGLLATGLLGLLGLWSVGMLGRRLAGPGVGLLGALFLALNGVQIWFSRYSTSEACAQFLCFVALYGFAVIHDPGRTSHVAEATTDDRPTATDRQATFASLIAGIAAGQLALARIDFLLIVAPLIVYLLYIALTRRWRRAHWALACGLGAMLLQALLHIIFISRAYFLDTLYARLQDQSAIVANLAYALWTPALRQQFMEIPRSATLRQPLRLPAELALLAALFVGLVLLRRYGRPLRWFEGVIVRYQRGLTWACAAVVVLLGVYGYMIRPQILTMETLAAAPGCLAPAQLRAPSGACLALQGYIGAPIEKPEHPNAIAYALDAAPKWMRAPKLDAAESVSMRQDADLREAPAGVAALDRVQAGESVQLIGRDADGSAYLVKNARLVTGWVISSSLIVDAGIADKLPVQPNNIVDKLVNPRTAVSFSFDNAGESEKFGIAQANLVRVGWYLSPLGVILGVAGFALWWRRGLNRASWLFLVASLISTFFFVRLTYGTSDLTYIYILRRYVPLTYPAFSLGMAYALVALARWTKDEGRRTKSNFQGWSFVFRLSSFVCAAALIAFFVATNQPLYRHVEYEGALAQLSTIAGRFGPRDVLLFRGEARDTPDLMITPLKYAFGLDTFAIRSEDPGKYAPQLARYVQRWQSQGRQVYLVLGANGAVELPGLRATRVGLAPLHLPEFQQLIDQKPRVPQAFDFEFVVYRLDPAAAAPVAPLTIAVDDYIAQVRGFYHPEQIGAARVAWTSGDALLRLSWPRDGAPLALKVSLAGGKRPAALGAAQACLSFRPETSFEIADLPFSTPQCFSLAEELTSYSFTIDPRGQIAPPTGTLLLRLTSDTWSPADSDAAQHDRRRLGVQFGGLAQD